MTDCLRYPGKIKGYPKHLSGLGLTMDQSLDILAFAPHPDDAEIGCGGSLILAAQQGYRVGIADLTKAEHSTQGNLERRQQETRHATRLLNITHRFNLGLPDTEIGAEITHRDPLIELIRKTRPQIILSPYWQDRHPDHAATGKLVKDAFFLAGVSAVGLGKAYRPQRLYHYVLHHPFEPSFIVDISPVWEQKIAAIEAYSSQFKPTDADNKTMLSQPSFLRFIEARAIYFGALIGAPYGEAFYSLGPLAMPGLPDIAHPTASGGRTGDYSVYSP